MTSSMASAKFFRELPQEVHLESNKEVRPTAWLLDGPYNTIQVAVGLTIL
jgi:hypothetical protein